MPIYRAGDLLPEIIAAAEAAGVPAQLAVGLFAAENSSNGKLDPARGVDTTTKGISPDGKPSGALGLFQVTGETLRGLLKQGYLPSNLDYSTKEGQIAAGIAALKAKMAETGSTNPAELAAYWSDGQAGLKGYRKQGPMPAQATGFIRKVATAMGDTENSDMDASVATSASVSGFAPKLADTADWASSAMTALRSAGSSMTTLLEAIGAGQSSAVTQAKLTQEALGEAKAEQLRAAGEIKVGVAASQQQNAEAFGATITQDSLMMRAQQAYAANLAHMQELKPQIDALAAKDPITDPVGWLVSQFQLRKLAPQYNAAVQNKDIAARAVATLQSSVANQNAITPAVSADLIRTETNKAAELAKAAAQAEIAKLDVDSYQNKARLAAEQYGVLTSQYSAAMQSFGFATTSERLEAKTSAADKADSDLRRKINEVTAPLGGMPITSNEELKAHSPQLRQLEARLATNSGDLGSALLYVKEMQTLPAIRKQSPIMAITIDNLNAQIQVESKRLATAKMAAGEAKPKDYDLYIEAADNVAKKFRNDIANAQGVMTEIPQTNPWKFDSRVALENPELQQSKLVIALRDLGNSSQPLSDKDILTQAIAQVTTGAMSQKQAVDQLVSLYTAGLAYQYSKQGMESLRLGTVPVGKAPAYRIDGKTMGTGGFFATYKPVNMQNAAEVDNLLTREIIAVKAGSFSMQQLFNSKWSTIQQMQPTE